MKLVYTLEDISDGNLYDIDDVVLAGTAGCEACSTCCHDVEALVVLTPYDVSALSMGLNKSFKELLASHLVLREDNKVLLPHLKMVGEDRRCTFLSEEGRCTVHSFRPNICRLFPLGRVYADADFKYFLQVEACVKNELYEVVVDEWLGIENYAENKAFLLDWYKILKALSFRFKFVYDLEEKKHMDQYLLSLFYALTLDKQHDFYEAFQKAIPLAKDKLGIL
jgi:hypothetical protein